MSYVVSCKRNIKSFTPSHPRNGTRTSWNGRNMRPLEFVAGKEYNTPDPNRPRLKTMMAPETPAEREARERLTARMLAKAARRNGKTNSQQSATSALNAARATTATANAAAASVAAAAASSVSAAAASVAAAAVPVAPTPAATITSDATAQ